jgi:hypothetical protein
VLGRLTMEAQKVTSNPEELIAVSKNNFHKREEERCL